MTTFSQYHLLVSYPPSNLNRDDTGRPKTAMVGGANRLRVSSQSLKRSWRTSEISATTLAGYLGTRTRSVGIRIREALDGKVDAKIIDKTARAIEGLFKNVGKESSDKAPTDKGNPIVFIGAKELAAIDEIAAKVIESQAAPKDEDVAKILSKSHGSADIAMFGRMLATNPALNCDAAVEVAHAFTVHKAAIEDDYYTAVDDLARRDKDEAASGHLDTGYFGAGVYYLYLCINEDLLLANLDGDHTLAALSRKALIEAALTVGPSGKRTSFASRARTSYVLAERGCQAPRSLSVAFLNPVRGTNVLTDAIKAVETQAAKFDRAYGVLADSRYTFDVEGEKGDLVGLLAFAAGEI